MELLYSKIKPLGWLSDQLRIQADGLSGNLFKMWPDVRDSAWIGGERDGWERVPYWLDGFIPLAFLLGDSDLISQAEFYVDSIISRQCEDGWICPCTKEERKTYDMWAYQLISKVLAQYFEYTGEEKVFQSLYRAMKCFFNEMKAGTFTLDAWGKFRWFETFPALQLLFDRTGEEWICELGKLIEEEGQDYPALTETWSHTAGTWTYEKHIVNIGMMMKFEAVTSKLFSEGYTDIAGELWEHLDRYHGTAVGTFTGDECLAGIGANHGTELCSVVELMYSCELLYAYTGDAKWAERLEMLAFNALPATLSDDMWTHQYDQMVNQIEIRVLEKPHFTTNQGNSHLFGLEPNYGCCTANFNQGWPKFAASAFMRTDGGIHSVMMIPSAVSKRIGDSDVKITVDTEYPFVLTGKYTVEVSSPVEFELSVRIPSWSKGFAVDGKKKRGKILKIKKLWTGCESFTLEFFDEPHLSRRPLGLNVLKYGPLVFSVQIPAEYRKIEYTTDDGVEVKFPYCDYELFRKGDWNYAFAGKDFKVKLKKGDSVPFSSKNPRIVIEAEMCKVLWDCEEGYDSIPANAPKSKKAISEKEKMSLVPYGGAKLRMTEMPLAIFKKEK